MAKTKWRKKPVVIEAEQYLPGTQLPAGVTVVHQEVVCMTMEGPLHVSPGDWIITGVRGENYPCKPDIFEATYEQVLDPKTGAEEPKNV